MKKLHIIGFGLGVLLLVAIIFIIVKVAGSTDKANPDETIQNDSTNNDGEDIISEVAVLTEGGVTVYLSSTEEAQNQSWYKKPYQLSNTLTQQDNLNITEVDNSAITTINIDTSKTYDPFYGIGASLEESTVYNLQQLTDEARKEFIYKLVDTEGSLSYANNELLLKGGKLNSNYIDELAMYYTRYVEE